MLNFWRNEMPQYQPTEEEIRIIKKLDIFRNLITLWLKSSSDADRQKYRSRINHQVDDIREIVIQAGCLEILTLSPPPMIGGPIMKNIDPFSYIFDNVFGHSLYEEVFDMLDKTIGIIKSGKFEKRRKQMQKTRVPMVPNSGKKFFWFMAKMVVQERPSPGF